MTFSDGDILGALPLDEQVRKWAIWAVRLDAVARGIEIEKFATELKKQGIAAPKKIINAALSEAQQAKSDGGRPSPVREIKPWHEEVIGPDVWDELCEMIRSHVILDKHATAAVAGWVLYSHCFDAFEHSPLLLIESATPRCGKTRLLELLHKLCPRALLSGSMSTPTIYRTVESYRPTLLIDECDTAFKDNPELRRVVNSGHSRDDAFVFRCVSVGDTYEPREFSVWCPKALALIQNTSFPDSTRDRSVRIELRRKLPSETVLPLNKVTRSKLNDMGRKVARLVADSRIEIEHVASAVEQVDLQSDRARDIWLPLAAVAVVCGAEAETAVRAAAVELTEKAESVEQGNMRERLFADVVKLTLGADWITTGDLIDRLCADDTLPWSTFSHGKAITPQRVASYLKPFGIRPEQRRTASGIERGYDIGSSSFQEAIGRWLPPETGTVGTSLQAENPVHDHLTPMRVVPTVPVVPTCGEVSEKMPVQPGTDVQMELTI